MPDSQQFDTVLRIRRSEFVGAAADQRLAGDIVAPLRRRLLLIGACLLAAWCLFQLGVRFGLFVEFGITWLDLLFAAWMLVSLVVLVVWRDASLTGLRLLEGAIFAMAAVFTAAWQWWTYRQGWYRGVGEDVPFLEIVGDSLTLPWFLLITIYGAAIPNSGRRCAAVVGALVAMGLFTVGVICWHELHLKPVLVQSVFTKVVIWLALGAIIAVYGSNRLQVLRREALAARALGQYTLKHRLGQGGMGEVFLAEHRLLRRPCALKLIRPEKVGDLLTVERFQREVKAMASLTHANAVQIFDYGLTDDGIFYYVMEYLRGMTLQELVDRHGPVPPARGVHLIRQVCGALGEAHARGLIHRDLKPSNIFVGECGLVYDAVKLLDFGLVQFRVPDQGPLPAATISTGTSETCLAQLTVQGAVPGTPLYLSPEQARAAPLDSRSDIFSLGLVCYFLLSGQTPFRRQSIEQTIAARLHDAVTALVDVCPSADVDLNAVVMRCLEKDPSSRFPDVEQLASALSHCSCSGRWKPADAAVWWRVNVPEIASGPVELSSSRS